MLSKIFKSVLLLFFLSAFLISINAQNVSLSLPDHIIETTGKQISIPVSINTYSTKIVSYNLRLTYNPEVINIDSISTVGLLGAGTICNPMKGNLMMGFIDIKGFKGKGILMYLKGHTVAKGTTDITLASGGCVYNNNIAYDVIQQGKVTVVDSLTQPPTWTGAGAAFLPNISLTEGSEHIFTYKAIAAEGIQLKYKAYVNIKVNKNNKPVLVKWIKIDSLTGEMSIKPPKGSAGVYAISVGVHDGLNKEVFSPITQLIVTRKTASKK